jgi:hypothetical protein
VELFLLLCVGIRILLAGVLSGIGVRSHLALAGLL